MKKCLQALAVALLVALPAAAADPDFYKRTGTKPPVSGEWLLGFGMNYVDDLGVSGAVGYHFKDAGITLLGEVGVTQLKGENGTTDFTRGCRTYQVPYSTDNHTETQVGFSILFTLGKPK